MTKWDEKMAHYAKEQEDMQAQALGGGNFVQTRGGTFSFKKEPVGDSMNVVVLESIFENDYYATDFDPDHPQPPVCFAFGKVTKDMVPHPDSSDPQNDDCKSCRHNVMGTAERGKGKRCKNVQRHAIITEDEAESPESVAKSEVSYIKTPVTSGQLFAKYSTDVSKKLHRPLFGVVTEFKIEKHPKYQFQILTNMKEEINDGAVFGALLEKHEEQVEAIKFPYLPPSDEPVEAPKANRKFAKPTVKGKR